MSKVALSNSPSDRNSTKSRGDNTESDNECRVKLSDSESSALRSCAGCGRRFVPTGPQRYCTHECYAASLRVPIEHRFWSKVNKHGPVPAHVPHLGPCWVWTASLVRGYGQIMHNRKPGTAHRRSWEMAYGAIPDGQSVLHKCDNRACVRPDHLFLGTQQDNLNDARAKGRLDESRPLTSTLTYQDRLAIQAARGYRGVCVMLARKYGVTKSCIANIRKGRFAGAPDASVAPVLERVPSRQVPVVGHVTESGTVQMDRPVNTVAVRFA